MDAGNQLWSSGRTSVPPTLLFKTGRQDLALNLESTDTVTLAGQKILDLFLLPLHWHVGYLLSHLASYTDAEHPSSGYIPQPSSCILILPGSFNHTLGEADLGYSLLPPYSATTRVNSLFCKAHHCSEWAKWS